MTRQYQTFLSRRRSLRPPEEYREPSEGKVAEFGAHFRRRKLALGDCNRPYQTPCPHEHACVRCPMLRMDPAQLPRLVQVEEDTHRLLIEARGHGWDGAVQALETTLRGVLEKTQMERLGSGEEKSGLGEGVDPSGTVLPDASGPARSTFSLTVAPPPPRSGTAAG